MVKKSPQRRPDGSNANPFVAVGEHPSAGSRGGAVAAGGAADGSRRGVGGNAATRPFSTLPRLRVLEGPDRGQVFELRLPAIIGRSPDAQVRLTCRSVSRHHAKLDRDERGYILTDAGSSYGIRVGANVSSAVRLTNGISFNLGDTSLMFETPEGQTTQNPNDTQDMSGGKFPTTEDMENTTRLKAVRVPDTPRSSGGGLSLWAIFAIVLVVGGAAAAAFYFYQKNQPGGFGNFFAPKATWTPVQPVSFTPIPTPALTLAPTPAPAQTPRSAFSAPNPVAPTPKPSPAPTSTPDIATP
jgi:hypothetical protein